MPLPHAHLVRYAGCLAPHSKLRAAIIPTPRQQGVDGEKTQGTPYWDWARLLGRIFDLDMAMFGAALDNAGHAQRAVLAALDLHQALHDEDTQWHASTAGLEVRLGLHTGPVLVSSVGDATGTSTAVLGDTAILATSVEQAAAPGTLLCSDATAGYAQEVGDIEAARPLWVEGRSTPLMLYRILTAVPVSR